MKWSTKVQIVDIETLGEIRFEKKVNLPEYSGDHIRLSSRQLSNSIRQSDEESVLVKSNLKIIPNVARIFGMDFGALYLYSEVYNLNFSAGRR